MSRELYEILRRLGFTQYEAKVYISLLMRGTATASELSDLSNIPYTRVYDVLNQLEEKGLVAIIPGRPLKFEALDPEIALSNYMAKLREELMIKIKELEENISKVQEILARYKKGFFPREKTICLRGRNVVINYLKRFLSSRGECDIFYSIGAHTIPEIKSFLDQYREKTRVLRAINTPSIIVVCDGIILIYELAAEKRYDYMIVSQSKPLYEIISRCIVDKNCKL